MLKLDWNIIWTFVNLIVLFLLLRKFLYRPVMAVIQARQKEVDQALADAEQARLEAQTAQAAAQERLEQAEAEARVREEAYEAQARRQADQMLAEARAQAAELVDQGRKRAETERDKLLRQAGQETADLACTLAGKLVGRSLNGQDEKRFLDELLMKVGEHHGN